MVVDVGEIFPEAATVADKTVPGMAEAIAARMRSQGLTPTTFAAAAGLTSQGLDPVRAGVRRTYQAKTRIGVARALSWPEDWYDRLVRGDGADQIPTEEWFDAPPSLEARVAAVESAVDELRDGLRRVLDRVEPPST